MMVGKKVSLNIDRTEPENPAGQAYDKADLTV